MKKYLKAGSLILMSMMVALSSFSSVAFAVESDGNTEKYAEETLCTLEADMWEEPVVEEIPAATIEGTQIEAQGEEEYEEEEYEEEELLFLLEDEVKEALLAGKTQVDIRDLHIDRNKYRIQYLQFFSPYFSNGIELTSLFSGDYYVEINLENSMSLEETEDWFDKIEKKVEEILAQVTDEMSDEKKARVIHDYFITQYEYEQRNPVPEDSFRSGGIFMNEIGVCMGYSYGYKYIMNLLGIECHVTSSEEMGHGWNIVKIGDSYYHVDCTWDDPVNDKFGKVRYGYFLVSDAAVQEARAGESGHYGWTLQNIVGDIPCDNTKYDKAYWADVTGPIIEYKDSVYYMKKEGIYKRTGEKESLVKNLGTWPIIGEAGSVWVGTFSGLILWGDEIYYNTAKEIRKFSPDSGKDELVYRPDISKGYIYGIRKYNQGIQYSIASSPEEIGPRYMLPSELPVYPEKISLDIQKAELEINDTVTIHYSMIPENADTDAEVTWSSDYPEIAAVNEKGVVTALSPGTAVIKAATGNGKTASCIITVYAPMSFEDVKEGQWYYDTVRSIYRKKIMTGMDDDHFGPEQPLARAQFAVILYRMNGEPEIGYSAKFKDVGDGIWYTSAILWANSVNMVNGYSDTGCFGPADNINREQMAAIMYRYAKYKKYPLGTMTDFNKFSDASQVNAFASEAMQWAVGNGIITGKDNGTRLDPQGNANRAECATIIQRFLEQYGE